MWQPQSIRLYLAAVFLLFFALVTGLGTFSIWRLSNFNVLSGDVAQVWLPTTRALGDLNNYTSDFRAVEGSNLLSSNPGEAGETERQMAALDRTIAEAERSFENIHHEAAENRLYEEFKEKWTEYRGVVNGMLELSRTNRKSAAIAVYGGASRKAYGAASDTLGHLTDRAVANAATASERLGLAYRQAVWLIGLVMLLAAVMVVAALLHVSRFISHPLLDLAERMRRLAANNTEVEIPESKRPDEIGEMTQAAVVFRNNAIELMQSQHVLARQTAVLEQQLAQEQRLALLQRNFVSMASHEFRTPLTIIDGHARRLDKTKDRVPPSEIAERTGKIRSAVLRMTRLIDNLLDSSRLMDAGAGQYLQPADMDLTALLQEVCQVHREMSPNAEIRERFGAAPMPIVADAKLLFQVFGNLLSNAIKYSPGGGAIEIDTALRPNEVMITITDHGIGIPASDLDRLFERYHRGGNVSGIVGTGVGLYLVKMVLDLHGGRIAVDSKEDVGTTFAVYLPIKAAVDLTANSTVEQPSSLSVATSFCDLPNVPGPVLSAAHEPER